MTRRQSYLVIAVWVSHAVNFKSLSFEFALFTLRAASVQKFAKQKKRIREITSGLKVFSLSVSDIIQMLAMSLIKSACCH